MYSVNEKKKFMSTEKLFHFALCYRPHYLVPGCFSRLASILSLRNTSRAESLVDSQALLDGEYTSEEVLFFRSAQADDALLLDDSSIPSTSKAAVASAATSGTPATSAATVIEIMTMAMA
jgi:hypothetical protein